MEPTEFLQGVSLLHTLMRTTRPCRWQNRQDIAAVSAKREHVLELPLGAYRTWADKLLNGFFLANQFLKEKVFTIYPFYHTDRN